MRRIARNPEVVVVSNPGPSAFRKGVMKRKKSSRRRSGGKRKAGAYARFVKSQWSKHKAKFKSLGIKKSSKIIAGMWKKR